MDDFLEHVQEMYHDMNEDKLWSMYLASQPEQTYDDWKKKVVGHTRKINQALMEQEEVKAVVEDSQNLLKNFKPHK